MTCLNSQQPLIWPRCHSQELENEAKSTFERYYLKVPTEFLKVIPEIWFGADHDNSIENTLTGPPREFGLLEKPLAEVHRVKEL